MRESIEPRKNNLRAFGWWLEDVLRHLTGFGVCLTVFGVVYVFGHAAGEHAGAARTKEAFETCGKAYCRSELFLHVAPAP